MNENVIKNLVRLGTVSSVDVAKRTARVEFKDKSGMVSGTLKVLQNHPVITVTNTVNGSNWSFSADYASAPRNLGLGESYDKEIPDTITLTKSIDYLCPTHGVDETKTHQTYIEVHPWLPYIGQMVVCLYLPVEDGDGFVIGGI